MSFTLEQIKSAHSKVKSGADFPAYIRDLIKLGVISYETFVSDGHTIYQGSGNYSVSSPPKYTEQIISKTSNKTQFVADLKHHQQGGSDYPTFCTQSAQHGVEKWKVDTTQLTCTYYDKAGNIMLEEKIPA